MRYILAPEFHRNLWEKFTPFRAAAAVVFLLLSVLVIQDAHYSSVASRYKSLAGFAIGFYFLIVFVWGNYEAAFAMPEEGRRSTWDFQRMSAQGAARLWFGKFFGATSYTWYVGCLTLAIFAAAYWDIPAPQVSYALYVPNHELPYILLLALLAGLTGQAAAFFGGVIEFQAAGGRGRWRVPLGVTSFLVGFSISSFAFMETAWRLADKFRHPHVLIFRKSGWQVGWYSQEFPAEQFYTGSLLFFAASALAAGYIAMRASLMHRVTPAPLMAFAAAFAAWFSGFGFNPGGLADGQVDVLRALFYGFTVTAGLCYAAILIEAGNRLKYARFAFHLRRHEAGKAFENMPAWLAIAVFPLAVMTVTAFYAGGAASSAADAGVLHIEIFMLTFLLFMARDACAVHLIHLFNRASAVFGILFYYLCIYVLLPMLGYALFPGIKAIWMPIGMLKTRLDDARYQITGDFIAPTFFPSRISDPAVSILPSVMQLALAALLLAWALKARRSNNKEAEK